VQNGTIVESFRTLETPDVVFIGGGFSSDLLDVLWPILPAGKRLVANSVTLESDADMLRAQSELGGELLRVELAAPKAIGSRSGWAARYPIMQWSVVK
jgi:precorrin-6Y C5,15-methyltransferase (decarboxylating)